MLLPQPSCVLLNFTIILSCVKKNPAFLSHRTYPWIMIMMKTWRKNVNKSDDSWKFCKRQNMFLKSRGGILSFNNFYIENTKKYISKCRGLIEISLVDRNLFVNWLMSICYNFGWVPLPPSLAHYYIGCTKTLILNNSWRMFFNIILVSNSSWYRTVSKERLVPIVPCSYFAFWFMYNLVFYFFLFFFINVCS